MTEILEDKKVITPVTVGATNNETYEYLIYFIFGVIETLLVFRFFLKIVGASTASSFVGLVYGSTGVLIMPFEGIFKRSLAQGIETTSVLEPSVIVGIVVYALLAWGIVRLVRIGSGEKQA